MGLTNNLLAAFIQGVSSVEEDKQIINEFADNDIFQDLLDVIDDIDSSDNIDSLRNEFNEDIDNYKEFDEFQNNIK